MARDEPASYTAPAWPTGSLGLLRLLTNRKILGDAVLDGAMAWRALQTWLSTTGVTHLHEPPGIDEVLGRWGSRLDLRAGHWTDGYLAAFATASGARLVSFDADFGRYANLAWQHLVP